MFDGFDFEDAPVGDDQIDAATTVEVASIIVRWQIYVAGKGNAIALDFVTAAVLEGVFEKAGDELDAIREARGLNRELPRP